MENNSIYQPLLSDNNEDQIFDFQQHAVTAKTSFQPLYGLEQSGNALIGNNIFGSINQGNSQFNNSNNMANIQVGISSGNHHLQQQQFTPTTQTSSFFDHFLNRESSNTSNVFEVAETNFKDYFFKIQCREDGTSIQRIKNGNITMVLEFKNKESRDQVADVVIKVKRTYESRLKPEKRAGEITIPFQDNKRPQPIQDKQLLVQIDLDSIHTTTPKGLLLYRLKRSQTELNFYHLVIEVHYNDSSIVTRNTKMFKLIGKENRTKASPAKRKRDDEVNMEGPSRKWTDQGYNSGIDGSPYSTSAPFLTGQNIDRIIRAKEVVAEHIKAKTLDIDGMHVGRMVTRKCDVAYHFLLKDNSEVFQEGEIVGFVKDPKNDNKQVICKLDYKLASESILKGVVTRSQYLEARLPENGVRSETICMLGMVPVQVIGSVHMNEPLYASPDRPGLAIGGHQLDVARLKEASFIGYSFSARKTDDDTSVGVVEAAVGILQSASQCLVSEKFRDIEEDFGEKFNEIKKNSRNRRRCFMITAILTTIFLMLLGILLWQLYMPGSKLRYYICRRGRMNPHGSANFWYISERNKYVRAHVNGIQFSFSGLIKKMGYTYLNRNLNGTGYRYYLNIDRCAYGQIRETKDRATGQKEVHGPNIFAVDKKCWHAYFYTDVAIKEEWRPYRGVYWPKYRNIFCNPEPPNRREERIESIDGL